MDRPFHLLDVDVTNGELPRCATNIPPMSYDFALLAFLATFFMHKMNQICFLSPLSAMDEGVYCRSDPWNN